MSTSSDCRFPPPAGGGTCRSEKTMGPTHHVQLGQARRVPAIFVQTALRKRETKVKVVNLSTLIPNPDNPRVIRDTQYARLLDSIKRDPQFMEKNKIAHRDGVIFDGNQRYHACMEATRDPEFRDAIGTKHEGDIPASWLFDASEWTDEQCRRWVLLANSPAGISGEWNWDTLANEWDEELLSLCGMEIPVVQIEEEHAQSSEQQQPEEPAVCPHCGYVFE